MLHCELGELSRFDDAAKRSRAQSIGRGAPAHPSLHFMLDANGDIHQYVDTANVAWGLDEFTGAFPTPRDISFLTWTEIHSLALGAGLPPDMYLIHVGIVVGGDDSALVGGCNGVPLNPTGLRRLGHLLAWLAQEYGVALSSVGVQFHQNVDSLGARECACADLGIVLGAAQAYCEEGPFPMSPRPVEVSPLWLQGAVADPCAEDGLQEVLVNPVSLIAGGIPSGEGDEVQYGVTKVIGDDLQSHRLGLPFAVEQSELAPSTIFGEARPPGLGPEVVGSWRAFNFATHVGHAVATINRTTALTRLTAPGASFAAFLLGSNSQVFANTNVARNRRVDILLQAAVTATAAASFRYTMTLYGTDIVLGDTLPPYTEWSILDQMGFPQGNSDGAALYMFRAQHTFLIPPAVDIYTGRYRQFHWGLELKPLNFVNFGGNDWYPQPMREIYTHWLQ